MCTIITHPAIPIALSALLPRGSVSTGLLIAGSICSVVTDLDVIGFRFGIRYSEVFGHRGFTHSICFALIFGGLLTLILFRVGEGSHWVQFLFLFLSTLSHPILDAFTNGGLGVALFSPFNNERYFFPWTPIEVSPISVSGFFSARGLEVILSELKWVWFPSIIVFTLGQVVKKYL